MKNTDSTKLGKLLKLSSFQNKDSLARSIVLRSSSAVLTENMHPQCTTCFHVQSNLNYLDLDYLDLLLWSQFFMNITVIFYDPQQNRYPSNFVMKLKAQIRTCFILTHAVLKCISLSTDWRNFICYQFNRQGLKDKSQFLGKNEVIMSTNYYN